MSAELTLDGVSVASGRLRHDAGMTRTTKLMIASAAAVAVVGGGAAVAVAQQDAGTPDLDRAADVALTEAGDGEVTGVEQDDDGGYDVEIRHPDRTETDIELNAAFEVVHNEREAEDDDGDDGDDGGRVDDDPAVDESARTQAAEAALAALDGGTVVSVEGDDGGYEVEVRDADGTEHEVRLDAGFTVISTERDD
jgi:uncharacterized membrane protein YkoI